MHLLSARLLQWYARNKRNLPWRKLRPANRKTTNPTQGLVSKNKTDYYPNQTLRPPTPYQILVSEAMLQQTRVDQAIPYYERFIEKFPTIEMLARAREDTVLKAWEGLGYYSRARNLHAAAKRIQQDGWPKTAEGLQQLPGVGPYISKAVAAIAFDQNEVAVDANLLRVGARFFGIRGWVNEPKTKAEIESRFRELLPSGRAGDFNQALMDLGSAVCLPKEPNCPKCPLRTGCTGLKNDIVAQLPRKRAKKKKPHQTVAVGVIWQNGRVLIAKRANKGLLAGLWEFPGGKKERGETLEEACRREIREETALNAAVGRKLAMVKHEYTHLKVTLHVFECTANGNPRISRAWKWVKPAALKRFAMPKSNHKFMDRIV